MRIYSKASSGGTTSQLSIETDTEWARFVLDTHLLYQVQAEDWPKFTDEVISVTALPPNLPADKWSTPDAHKEGSGFLRQGERQQLLISSIHLAAQIPSQAVFDGESFDTLAGASAFHGRHFRDPQGNFLYVPETGIQVQLLDNLGQSREMCSVGYLFDFESQDEQGNIARFFYRPYNTGFATSSRWPADLQRLREQIERGRHA